MVRPGGTRSAKLVTLIETAALRGAGEQKAALVEKIAGLICGGGPCPGRILIDGPSDITCGGYCLTTDEYRTCWATAIVNLVSDASGCEA